MVNFMYFRWRWLAAEYDIGWWRRRNPCISKQIPRYIKTYQRNSWRIDYGSPSLVSGNIEKKFVKLQQLLFFMKKIIFIFIFQLRKQNKLNAPAINAHDSVTRTMVSNYYCQKEAIIDALKVISICLKTISSEKMQE